MKTTKPNKQHKRLYQAPLHKRYKQFSASLSTKLKESHNANSIPVRLGDTVQIMRGDRKGFEGKITKVDRAAYRISVEGVTREKVDGTTTPISIHPSKVRITQLNLDDKRRREALKRKGIGEKAELLEMRVTEEMETKPARKTRKRKKKTSQQTNSDTKKRSPKKKVEKST